MIAGAKSNFLEDSSNPIPFYAVQQTISLRFHYNSSLLDQLDIFFVVFFSVRFFSFFFEGINFIIELFTLQPDQSPPLSSPILTNLNIALSPLVRPASEMSGKVKLMRGEQMWGKPALCILIPFCLQISIQIVKGTLVQLFIPIDLNALKKQTGAVYLKTLS